MKHILSLLICLLPLQVFSQSVELSSYFGDNMVLQRSHATTIIGKAAPNIAVPVTLHNAANQLIVEALAKSDNLGNFKTTINLKNYGTGNTLKIGDKTLSNVAVGEVWLVSGQSNMAWSLSKCNEASSVKDDENVRLLMYTPNFEVVRIGMSEKELQDINNLTPYAQTVGWQMAQGSAAQEFSAVAMFFASRLRAMMPRIPIGLIQTAMGGAPIESFLPREAIEKDPALKGLLERYWVENEDINDWCRNVGRSNLKGVTDTINQRHYFEPTYLYDARMMPLKGTTVKGVLWYQGESNADNIKLHNRAFINLVDSWRALFGNGQLPFYFVQLSSNNRPSWPAFRDSQRLLSQRVEFCEMVVSHDHGNPTDVHPLDKKPIGERLANIALYRDYNFQNIQPYSPSPRHVNKHNILLLNNGKGISTNDNEHIRGFEVSDDGENFTKIEAWGFGDRIKLVIPSRPRYLRYGWTPSTDANVVNAQGLPLSTFKLKLIED